MARQRKDPRTTALLEQMETTRAELLEVVEGLVHEGVTRRQIAAAAGWNPGYMSDFLTQRRTRPTPSKIEELISALGAFVPDEVGRPELPATLKRVADRYGVRFARVINPTASQIPASAPNYVRRADVDDALKRACELSGSYAIAGQPMTGISTALLLVADRLRELGHEVRHLSASTDFIQSGFLERSRTGILGAVAAAIARSEEPLDLDFYAAQAAVHDSIADFDAPFALLLDDVNGLEPRYVESLKLLLRDWATRRAKEEGPFHAVTIWLAMTSAVRDVRWHSTFLADYVMMRPFEKDEVRQLARALAPYASAGGVRLKARWHIDAADAAWDLFAGQPHLSHVFLWERHNDGKSSATGVREANPIGPYKRHIERLARSLAQAISPARALSLVQELDAGRNEDIYPGEIAIAESLGVATPEGGWACAYYTAHLPQAIRRVTAESLAPTAS